MRKLLVAICDKVRKSAHHDTKESFAISSNIKLAQIITERFSNNLNALVQFT
jgi:hypothetical protein